MTGVRPAARDEDVGCSSLPATQEKDPEGRMPLVEHLRELRNRLAKAVLAIVVVMIVAAFYSERDHRSSSRSRCRIGGCEELGERDSDERQLCARSSPSTLCAPFTTRSR